MVSKLATMRPTVPRYDGRAVQPPPQGKATDPYYLSPDHRAWRAAVLARAGYQCQAVEHGRRCTKGSPHHRLFADHIIERQDQPSLALDVANGQCLCGAHHTIKTMQARASRLGAPAGRTAR